MPSFWPLVSPGIPALIAWLAALPASVPDLPARMPSCAAGSLTKSAKSDGLLNVMPNALALATMSASANSFTGSWSTGSLGFLAAIRSSPAISWGLDTELTLTLQPPYTVNAGPNRVQNRSSTPRTIRSSPTVSM